MGDVIRGPFVKAACIDRYKLVTDSNGEYAWLKFTTQGMENYFFNTWLYEGGVDDELTPSLVVDTALRKGKWGYGKAIMGENYTYEQAIEDYNEGKILYLERRTNGDPIIVVHFGEIDDNEIDRAIEELSKKFTDDEV